MSTPFLGAAVAALTWPIRSIAPTTGPDPSWVAGLYMALGEGFRFGEQLVFTYGPLGFLQEPALYDEGLWTVAFSYRGFVHVAVAISLLWVARRAFPLAVALAVCYMLLVIGYLEGAVALLALVWCLVALGDNPPRFAVPLVVVGGGAIGAIELLGKANYGIAVLALCSVTVLGLPGRRRNAPLFTGVALLSLGALWLLAGQGLSNVSDFASNGMQLLSGYSGSMSTDITDASWERPFAVVAMALLLAGAVLATWRDPLPRRLASLAVVALFAFLSFKQGFVRQGLGNTPDFFALMLGGGIAVAARLPARLPRVPRRSAAFALVAPLTALTIAALPSPSFWRSLEPDSHITFLRQELHAFLSAGERDRVVSAARRSMRSAYRLDRPTLRLLGDRPVHVDPWEIGAAWAYGLNWRPLPVIQDYLAYTPALDRLNADALEGPGAPATILRQNTAAFGSSTDASIDDRYPGWDPPAATLAMLCHYRAVRTTRRWQLLERVTNRCGPPRQIDSVRTRTGEEVRVPPPPSPRHIVFARIHGLGVEGWETLRSALYRARPRTATLDRHAVWRLAPETAHDGLIMRAPGLVDYPEPFRLAPDAQTLAVQVQGDASRDVAVEFYAQRVRREPPMRTRSAPGSAGTATTYSR